MKALWFYGRFSEAMSFSKFATSVPKLTIDVPKIAHCVASPGKVSALALENEDSMNKEKHSLQCYNPGGGNLLTEIPPYYTSIVTFDTKEANFASENGSRIKTLSSKPLILVSFCWKKNFLRVKALTNLI